MSGENFNLNNDNLVLQINSPKNKCGGPYKVVFKDLVNRWAIVALDWENEPRLGIRWFWDKSGNPLSTGHPIWFIMPTELYKTTLDGLPLEYSARNEIEDFLKGKIKGHQFS